MLGIRGLLHAVVHPASYSNGQVGGGGCHGLLRLLLLVLRLILSLGRRREVVGRVKIRDGSTSGLVVHGGVEGGDCG
jgi:hypothetical protein